MTQDVVVEQGDRPGDLAALRGERGRRYDLRDPRRRARVYEIVLREGGPQDVLAYIDGVLLVDLWDELVVPRAVRTAWHPVVTGATAEQVA